MKIIIMAVIVLVVFLAVGRDMIIKPSTISPGTVKNNSVEIDPDMWKPAPQVVLTTLAGEAVPLERLKGKVTLLTFWATWCPSCSQEFPALLKLVRDFNGQVVLVMISSDENKEIVANFLSGYVKDFAQEINGPSLIMAWDQNQHVTTNVFNTLRYPETIILSKDLRMARKVVGAFDWNGKEVTEYLKMLISLNS